MKNNIAVKFIVSYVHNANASDRDHVRGSRDPWQNNMATGGDHSFAFGARGKTASTTFYYNSSW